MQPDRRTQQGSICLNDKHQQSIDSPMQIKLINFLGLRKYLMEKFIFQRKQSTYKIRKQNGRTKLFMPNEYRPPIRYELQVGILEQDNHSIPFVKLIPRNKKVYHDTIVYAHGNSSDMSDGLKFMERMALIYQAQYVIFDYNGYGQSKNSEVGEQTIRKDIEIVLAWLNKPLNQIILWGFSLGSYPVLWAASKYFVKGVILQCPIASVGCFFHQNLFTNIKFKQDYFANINLIQKVKGKIFMVHSHSDQVIPINHVQLLFDKYVATNGKSKIFFIQVMKLPHNGLHKYIVAQKQNDLQKQLVGFLEDLKGDEVIGYQKVHHELENLNFKVKSGEIDQLQSDESYHEIGGDLRLKYKNQVKNSKVTCFCFTTEPSLHSSRQKFRVD